jgi:hypothetical protein
MRFKPLSATALLCLGLLVGGSAFSQKMYRCGNSYQDRPCEGTQVSKNVRDIRQPSPQTAVASQDAQCRQRGIAAQKIVWSREGGALAEQLIAEEATKNRDANAAADMKSLIMDVYNKRGSAPEVRAAIEADCVAAKKQAALAAAIIAAEVKQQGKDTPAAGAGPSKALEGESPIAAAPQNETPVNNAAENHRKLCASISNKIEVIQNAQRGGGSVSAMENLRLRAQDAAAERVRAGC